MLSTCFFFFFLTLTILQASRSVKGTKPLQVLRSCCAHSAFSPLVSKGGAHTLLPSDRVMNSDRKPRPQATSICLPRPLVAAFQEVWEQRKQLAASPVRSVSSWEQLEGGGPVSKYQSLGNRALAEQSSLLFSKKAEPGGATPENRARSRDLNAGSRLLRHSVLGHPTVTSPPYGCSLRAEGRKQLRVKGQRWTGSQSKTKQPRAGAR